MTTTTANISWAVPLIAYTPENYTVTYYGLELQPETRDSALVVGDPTNILATDRVYFVLLEGLEEANTYNYTVNAINCNGTTSTDMMNFTTMPDREIPFCCSLVLNYINYFSVCERPFGMIMQPLSP